MLGAVGLRHGGGRIDPVQAPRPRLILAMLGARTGRPVLEDQLIDGIWGQAPPSSARTAVQTYLSALRDLLEPDRPRRSPGRFIATDGGGYVLDPTAAQVDLVQFEHEVSSGIRQASDDPVAAVELLDRALARWGEPFSELNSEPWAAGVAARLRERHSNALEARFGLALAFGQEGFFIEDLRDAVELYPYRERLAGQLMLSLYRVDDQAGALVVARSVRRRLLDELGLDPSPELVELESRILHHDAALLNNDDTPPEPEETRPTIARSIAPIIGRDDLVNGVRDAVRTHRVVSLVGPGGVGKSSIAAHVEAGLTAEFDTGHVVDVAELPAHLAGDVIRSIAISMGVTEHTLAALDHTLCDAIGSTPTLLVLETAEVAPAAVAEVVECLSAAPGLHILVTSQVPIRSTGEHVVRVDSARSRRRDVLVDRSAPPERAARRGDLGKDLRAARLHAARPRIGSDATSDPRRR